MPGGIDSWQLLCKHNGKPCLLGRLLVLGPTFFAMLSTEAPSHSHTPIDNLNRNIGGCCMHLSSSTWKIFNKEYLKVKIIQSHSYSYRKQDAFSGGVRNCLRRHLPEIKLGIKSIRSKFQWDYFFPECYSSRNKCNTYRSKFSIYALILDPLNFFQNLLGKSPWTPTPSPPPSSSYFLNIKVRQHYFYQSQAFSSML